MLKFRSFLLLITPLCLFLTLQNIGLSENAKPCNFVIFYADDLGWTDTSVPMVQGDGGTREPFYETPNLERHAKRGTVFSNGYAAAPTCTPSRISIQFGKTPARLRQTTVHDIWAKQHNIDCRDEVSLAKMLQLDAGSPYQTAHFGKGVAIRKMKTLGYHKTDEFDRGDNGNYHGDYKSLDEKVPLPPDNPKRIFSLTKSAVDFIEEQTKEKRPFLLMVSHYAVHVQSACLAKTWKKYSQKKNVTSKRVRPNDFYEPIVRRHSDVFTYAAMIENLDTSFGAILDALEKGGVTENTYVFFISDNGGGYRNNPPLAGGKAHLLEGGIRTPFVVAGPGVQQGAYCDVPVMQWDILPTLHDLAGVKAPLPEKIDGGSLRDVLTKGNKGEVVRKNVPGLIFHYPYYTGFPAQAIRVGDYKLLRQLNTGEIRLHNLAEDVGEKVNLAKEMPEKVKELDGILQKYLKEVGAQKIEEVYAAREKELLGYQSNIREQYIPRLEKLLADPKKTAAEKKAVRDRIEQFKTEELPRLQKQYEGVAKNRKNAQW